MIHNALRALSLTICALSFSLGLVSQTTITLGETDFDNNQIQGINGPYSYTNNSSRTQTLITAQELINQGLTEGNINSIAFNVLLAEGGDLEGFNISMGNLDGNFGNGFENGLSTVFAPQTVSPVEGWNTHVFDTPFFWDGASDIVLETCYQNDAVGQDAHVIWYSFSAFGGGDLYKESDNSNLTNACDDNGSEDQFFGPPQLQLTWTAPQFPPAAEFNIASSASCSGLVQVTDVSDYDPTEWLWYFGDGTTATGPDASHTYTSNGSYTISLVVENEFGEDSVAIENAITVNLATMPPVAASCVPVTQNLNSGFGAVNVSLNGLNVTSQNGTVGYEDLTCSTFNVDQGVSYTLDIEVEGPADNFVVAWIDYNADGSFTAEEKVLSQQTDQFASSDFTVPTSALTDSTLRMRVIADFYQLGEPGPCSNPSGGQAEDIGLRITPNTQAPVAAFSWTPSFTCDGVVNFSDESEFAPSSWLYQFGDATFSTSPNPSHTYTESGTYTVSLTVQNSFGQDDTVMTDIIVVDLSETLTNACTPGTQTYCCDYGIVGFDLGTDISVTSENAVAGYEDFTCGLEANLTEGLAYPITINTGTENPHDVKVYVDLDDDGTMEADEIVYTSFNEYTHSGTITIPEGVGVLESRIRLRVTADFVGNSNNSCSEPQYGQVEDYAIILYPDTTPPTASFAASPLTSCDGVVDFTNLSQYSDQQTWYFGDSNTSTDQEPTHTYLDEGTYTVSLVVSNDYGTDSVAIDNYITVDFDIPCDTVVMEVNGPSPIQTGCNGYLVDAGGIDGNYPFNSDASTTITVSAGDYIRLEFSSFLYQFNGDFLLIYDGIDDTAPLIGSYTGNTLPEGGIVESSGNSITIVHQSNFFGQTSGFFLEWSCLPLSLDELSAAYFDVFPNPSSGELFIRSNEMLNIEGISLIDMTGRVLEQFSGSQYQLDLSAYEAGNYLLQIHTERGIATKRIVVR